MRIRRQVYRGLADDQRVRDFLSRHYAATRHPYFSVDPPNWERTSAAARLGSKRQRIQLWELGDHPQRIVVGILLYHQERCEFSYLVDPMVQEIESEMVDWVEREHQAAGAIRNEKNPLRCTVCEKNKAQKALLTQRGYFKGEIGSMFRKRSLDGDFMENVLPQGYRMQEVQDISEEQFGERVSAEGEIFGDPFSAALYQELQEAPIYRPELDLVITASDGSIAAFCSIWIDGVNQIGFYEPVATVPAYRCCGLGKALMVEGFRRLQMMGGRAVYLGNDVDNNAGNYLYDSVGMQVFDQEYSWQLG